MKKKRGGEGEERQETDEEQTASLAWLLTVIAHEDRLWWTCWSFCIFSRRP